MSDATDLAIERMKTAAGKAAREADAQKDHGRMMYSDGTAHGLREAIRMIEEERAARPTSNDPICGAKIDGDVCRREPDHTGDHCPIAGCEVYHG